MIRLSALLVALVGGFSAQEEGEPLVRCTRCRNLGARPCGEHPGVDCTLEGNALYCSVVGACDACGGAGWVDCGRCENPSSDARLEGRRSEIPGLADEYAYFERDLGRELALAVSSNFVLVWDLERLQVGKKWKSSHELLHLYVDRLERMRSEYVDVLDVEEGSLRSRVRILVWSTFEDHEAAALLYCSQTAPAGVKLMGQYPTYTVPAVKRLFASDAELHRNLVHSTSHLLLSHQEPMGWMGITKGGWADAGLAHWFEDRFFGICDNYCYQEQDTNRDFRGGKWRPAVRKLVQRGEAPGFGSLFEQNTDTLTLEQHAVAFSLVDYLVALDGAKLNSLLELLREKKATRDVLKKTFGVSVLRLQEDWQRWVLETYPTR